MTAVAQERPRGTALRVTQARVLRSEWTKFRSLRSTVWTLLVAAVLMVGLAALFAAVTASRYDGFTPAERADFSAVQTSLAGITFAQLAVAVLGVLLVTGEYTTGMIRASLTVVPRRLAVLWAKTGVLAAAVLALSLVTVFAAFAIAQALLGTHLSVGLGAHGVVRSLLGASAYLTLVGVVALALGSLLRSTAGGISTVVGVFFVLPPLAGLLPSSWTSHVLQYLPSNAGAAMFDGTMGVDHPLSPAAGLAVLGAYTVVLLGIAAWRLATTDA